jgi:hypothetical protein
MLLKPMKAVLKASLLKEGSLIAVLVIVVALITACGATDVPVTTEAVQSTATPVLPTSTPIPATATPASSTSTSEPTVTEEVERIRLELTFQGESCTYEGPTDLKAGPVTIAFHNKTDGAAASNMIRLLGDKTFQDVIDYSYGGGEPPSLKHAPSWSVDVPGVWGRVEAGDSRIREVELRPGIHAWVCARLSPFGVWVGPELTVED